MQGYAIAIDSVFGLSPDCCMCLMIAVIGAALLVALING
jgi:hypothetical protein